MNFTEKYTDNYFNSIDKLQQRMEKSNAKSIKLIVSLIFGLIGGIVNFIINYNGTKFNCCEKFCTIIIISVIIGCIINLYIQFFNLNKRLAHKLYCKYLTISNYYEVKSSGEIFDFYKVEKNFYDESDLKSSSRCERNIFITLGIISVLIIILYAIPLINNIIN